MQLVPRPAGRVLLAHASRRLRAARVALVRRRRALVCAAALTVIAVVSSLTASLLWAATAERRLEVGGYAPAAVEDEATLVKAPPQHRDGSTAATGSERRTTSGSTAKPQADTVNAVSGPSVIPGRVLGAGAAGAAVLAGALAAAMVLRRYRPHEPGQEGEQNRPQPRADAAPVVDDEPAAPADAAPVVDEGLAAPADAPLRDDQRAPEHDTTPSADTHDASGDGPAARSPERSSPAASDPLLSPPAAGTLAGLPPAERPDRTSWAVESAQTGARSDFTLAGANPVTGHVGARPQYSAAERVFEKRKSPRIAFACAGQLQWRAGSSQVAVLDLSELGLRCRLPLTTARQTAPKPPQTVLIAFPVAGHTVDATARVAWRKSTTEGVELGLEFTGVSEQHAAVLRVTCSAGASPGLPDR